MLINDKIIQAVLSENQEEKEICDEGEKDEKISHDEGRKALQQNCTLNSRKKLQQLM